MNETDGTNALDIANLDTQPVEHSEEYEGASEFYRPPEPGKKDFILDEAPGDDKFGGLKAFDSEEAIPGFYFNGKWKIVGGEQDDQTFFAMLDTRKKRDREGSDVEDYVRALEVKGQTVKYATYGDLKTSIQTAFATVSGRLTWTGDKCPNECGAKRLKLSQFPLKADGKTRDHIGTCACGEKVGARAKIAAIFINPTKQQ